MRRGRATRYPALAAAALLAGCIPHRDNEADPSNIEAPPVRLLRLESFSCRQWIYPFVDGFDALHAAVSFSVAERLAIDGFCDARCPILDPGGPDDPDYEPNGCQESRVFAGALAVAENTLTCDGLEDEGEGADGTTTEPLVLGFVEDAAPGADPSTMDVAVWASVGGKDILVSVVESDLGNLTEESLRVLPLASVTTSDGIFLTDGLREQLPEDARLLTRSLVNLDIQRLDLTLKARNRIETAETTCHVRLEFDPSLEVVQHPNGIAGDYGRHVAVGNLAMDRGALPQNPLEVATSYRRPDGACLVDLLYRDRTTKLRSWGRDGNEPIASSCDANGAAPPVAFARFADAMSDSLVYPAPAPGILQVLVGTTGFGLESSHTLVWRADAAASPAEIAAVGDFDGDGRSEIAVISDDRAALVLCRSTDASCSEVAMPLCQGDPVTRIAAVAPEVYALASTSMVAVVQTADASCAQWWSGNGLAPSRSDAFSGRPDAVSMHWSPREYDADPVAPGLQSKDRPIAVIVGAVNAGNPFSLVHEIDPVTSFTRVSRVTDPGCSAFSGSGLGIGLAAASVLERECGTETCRTRERRLVGVPGIDQGAVFGAGTLARFDGGACGAGAYTLDSVRFGTLSPVGLGSAIASRLDPERARKRARSSASPCVAPSVIAIGAPGGGAVSAAGHVIVVYEHVGDDGSAECEVTLP